MLVPAAGGRIILSMAPTLKKVLLAALSLFVVLATAAGLQLWREAKRPKRAWVAYSEKERTRVGETEEWPTGESEVFAQRRIGWLMSSNKSCLVLTGSRPRAHYLVNISVIRYREGKILAKLPCPS